MVADESIKEKGIDIGDTIIDPVSKKEFTIVGFTKDQMFSHTPVVYVNEDVWGAITQPNQKDYSAIALNTDKEIKMLTLLIKEVLQSIPGFKEEQGTLTMIIAFLLIIAALLIGVFFYVITLQKHSN